MRFAWAYFIMPFPFFLGFIVLNNKVILRVKEQVECSKVRIKSNISVGRDNRRDGKTGCLAQKGQSQRKDE